MIPIESYTILGTFHRDSLRVQRFQTLIPGDLVLAFGEKFDQSEAFKRSTLPGHVSQ